LIKLAVSVQKIGEEKLFYFIFIKKRIFVFLTMLTTPKSLIESTLTQS